jgi:hypothetical protein
MAFWWTLFSHSWRAHDGSDRHEDAIGTNVAGKRGDNRGFGVIRILVPMLVYKTAPGDAILPGRRKAAGMGARLK